MVIYKTTNLVNGKIYVGMDSKNDPRYLGSGSQLEDALGDFGRANFSKEILEYCTPENICQREIYWIAKLDTCNPKVGYNVALGGSCPMLGRRHSMDARLRMSEAKSGERSILYGKPLPESMRLGISRGNTGKVRTLEARMKVRAAHIGKKHGDEAKKKMHEYWEKNGHPSKGKPRTEEVKQKCREAWRRRLEKEGRNG